MTAVIRSSASGSANATSANIALPVGATAGDLCVLFIGCGYALSSVSSASWNILDNKQGANWNGAIVWAILTAADVTAGTVTVTMQGSYNFCWSIVCLQGPFDCGPFTSSQNASGSTSVALAASTSTAIGDLVFLFGSNRAADVPTVDQGTMLQTVNSANASCVLNDLTAAAAGTFTANFAYLTAGAGNYQAILSVYTGTSASSSRVSDNVVEGAPAATIIMPRLSAYVVEGQITTLQSSRISDNIAEGGLPGYQFTSRLSAYVVEGPPGTRQQSQIMLGTF